MRIATLKELVKAARATQTRFLEATKGTDNPQIVTMRIQAAAKASAYSDVMAAIVNNTVPIKIEGRKTYDPK